VTAVDLLSSLLTLEGLLFAGLAAAGALASSRQGLKSTFPAAAWLARAAAASISLVAVGAEAGWVAVFAYHWPHGVARTVAVVCLAVGIALPPAAAWALAVLGFRKAT
jgi:hypothetical protein